MHVDKYPLVSPASGLSKVPLSSGSLAQAEGDDDEVTDAFDRRSSPFRNVELLQRRRGRMEEGCARAVEFLRSCIGDRGLQSNLEKQAGDLDLPPRKSPIGPSDSRDPRTAAEVYSSALALAWLPTLPADIRSRLVGWVARHLSDRGPVPFFDGDTGGCVESTGMALLGLWRVGVLDAEASRRGAQSVLRSGAATAEALADEVGIFGTRWRRPPGSSGPADPGTVVQALFPVLLALRLGRSTLVDPVDLGDDEGPFVVAEIVQQNLSYLVRHLSTPIEGTAIEGTARYPMAEVFLCLATELWRTTTPLSATLRTPLEKAICRSWSAMEGTGDGGTGRELDALRLSALLIAAENLHLGHVDLEQTRLTLLEHQRADGSFAAAPFSHFQEPDLYFGSAGLSTVFALRALQGQPRSGAWGRRH